MAGAAGPLAEEGNPPAATNTYTGGKEMPQEVAGDVVPNLGVASMSQPKQELKTPSATPKCLNDLTTYLVAPGISNCVVLTAYHPATRSRAMLHYNQFGGNCDPGVKALFDGLGCPVEELEITVACNQAVMKGGSSKPKLWEALGKVLPDDKQVLVRTRAREVP